MIISVDNNAVGEPLADLLWENPSPTSNWTGANITLPNDITNYEGIVIYTRISTSSVSDDCMGTVLPPIILGYFWMVGYCIYQDSAGSWTAVLRRPTKFMDNTTLYIGATGDAGQQYGIPVKIVGLKKVS